MKKAYRSIEALVTTTCKSTEDLVGVVGVLTNVANIYSKELEKDAELDIAINELDRIYTLKEATQSHNARMVHFNQPAVE